MNISAVVLTRNEVKNIKKCLDSLDFCEEIIIIDDFSTDKTTEIIQNLKSKVKIYSRKLGGDFAAQRNFGLSKAKSDWILFLDADEEITPELKKEIANNIKSENSTEAFFLKRRDYFWGRELRHGELAKVTSKGLIRLVKKDSGKWMGNVHEVFHTARNCKTLNGHINHYPHPTLSEFIKDINKYSTLRAHELQRRGYETNLFKIVFMPIIKFIFNYFIMLGFLDGAAGFTYSFMMSFHSFLVRSKLYQLNYLGHPESSEGSSDEGSANN
ncbi:MAG: Glycosyl transferase family 2 [Candidatus Roizmanbacteria bacterium GW2011_GWA2_35_19]|uniref:Glycosyl transferase family 2 n=2 Tax=Candidatus Roizmaniibacteriota TaxID=1752723 RepID=A0A0G0BQ60_9BACT|nr:MAG: Glycosyl transferase family 2 [Candidatus Roizmanbacteria bacterium GW2011_GWC2_35_12]KKP71553.1 MAG: Glycosyl transferase family 2 [Candidatus Roizmanbacteria bacterium GW2011_GWA2_35_19]